MFLKKICVVVFSRANYGSIKSLLKEISKDKSFDLTIVAGGSAILSKFGGVAQLIKKDGFKVSQEIFFVVEGETPETMVKSNTMNLKDKTFVVYTDGVTEGYLKNGEELGSEGVQNIINSIEKINPKNIVLSIEKELNWGAEKLRDDITCMAINIENTELIKKK